MTTRIDAIRARLAAAEAPWTLTEGDPQMNGRNWTIRREGKPGIVVSAHEYGFGQLGEFIANAPADLAWLIERVEAVQDALNRHPRVCDTHEPGAPITCGWKHAVADIENAMKEAPDGP